MCKFVKMKGVFSSIKSKRYGFSLPELLVVLVIIGILVLVALPNLMPLISRAKATEAQQQLTFLHSPEQSYFYTYSRYSDDLFQHTMFPNHK